MYVVQEDTVLSENAETGVLANDSGATPLKAFLQTGPNHGELVLDQDGSFVYTPNPNYSGPDAFTYSRRTLTTSSRMSWRRSSYRSSRSTTHRLRWAQQYE